MADATQIQTAAWNSLVIAVATTVLSVVIGTAGALVVSRSRAPWARALDALLLSPLVLPALAFGFACLMYFSLIGLTPSVPLLIIGHTIVCFPFVMRTTVASLAQLDPGLLEASESLGGGAWMTFRRVILPLIGKGIAAGAFIAFMSSFDNVPVSLFLADARTEVLPIHMWQIIDNDLDVRTAAVSGVLVAFTIVLMILAERFAGLTRQTRRDEACRVCRSTSSMFHAACPRSGMRVELRALDACDMVMCDACGRFGRGGTTRDLCDKRRCQ